MSNIEVKFQGMELFFRWEFVVQRSTNKCFRLGNVIRLKGPYFATRRDVDLFPVRVPAGQMNFIR